MHILKYLVSREFWFYINPIRYEAVDKLFFTLVILAVVGAVGLYIASKLLKNPVWRKLAQRLSVMSASFGVVGALWVGCRYELVPWFGTHTAFVVLVVIAGVWKLRILWHFWRTYKMDIASWQKAQMKDKYLTMASK